MKDGADGTERRGAARGGTAGCGAVNAARAAHQRRTDGTPELPPDAALGQTERPPLHRRDAVRPAPKEPERRQQLSFLRPLAQRGQGRIGQGRAAPSLASTVAGRAGGEEGRAGSRQPRKRRTGATRRTLTPVAATLREGNGAATAPRRAAITARGAANGSRTRAARGRSGGAGRGAAARAARLFIGRGRWLARSCAAASRAAALRPGRAGPRGGRAAFTGSCLGQNNRGRAAAAGRRNDRGRRGSGPGR